jgi:hypothetical protein
MALKEVPWFQNKERAACGGTHRTSQHLGEWGRRILSSKPAGIESETLLREREEETEGKRGRTIIKIYVAATWRKLYFQLGFKHFTEIIIKISSWDYTHMHSPSSRPPAQSRRILHQD